MSYQLAAREQGSAFVKLKVNTEGLFLIEFEKRAVYGNGNDNDSQYV